MSEQAVEGAEPVVKAPPVSADVALAMNLISTIETTREKKFRSNIKAKPRASIWASQFTDCERQMTYEFLNWQDKKLHTWELEALFEAGREEELSFKAQLSDIGRRASPSFELVEGGASMEANAPARELSEKYGIHGYLDTKFKFEGKRILCEMKLMNQHGFDAIRPGVAGVEDLARNLFYRKYLRQGQMYMAAGGDPVLIFALTDGRGRWKFVILERDQKEIDRLLAVATRVNMNVAAKTLPDRIPYDTSMCGRCAFQHVCIPDIKAVPSQKIEGNEMLAEMLERRDQIVDRWREVEKIDKGIKALFEDVKDGVFTSGNFVITRKGSETTRYELPDDIKAKYAVKKPMFKNKIERFAQPDPTSIYLEPKKRNFDFGEED
jgi:hypothetical protein